MRLDKNYTLERIPYNVILRYVSDPHMKNHKGKQIMVQDEKIYYFPNVKLALKKYAELSHDVETYDSLIESIKMVELKIDNLNEKKLSNEIN